MSAGHPLDPLTALDACSFAAVRAAAGATSLSSPSSSFAYESKEGVVTSSVIGKLAREAQNERRRKILLDELASLKDQDASMNSLRDNLMKEKPTAERVVDSTRKKILQHEAKLKALRRLFSVRAASEPSFTLAVQADYLREFKEKDLMAIANDHGIPLITDKWKVLAARALWSDRILGIVPSPPLLQGGRGHSTDFSLSRRLAMAKGLHEKAIESLLLVSARLKIVDDHFSKQIVISDSINESIENELKCKQTLSQYTRDELRIMEEKMDADDELARLDKLLKDEKDSAHRLRRSEAAEVVARHAADLRSQLNHAQIEAKAHSASASVSALSVRAVAVAISASGGGGHTATSIPKLKISHDLQSAMQKWLHQLCVLLLMLSLLL
jgi:hypothetical protein